MILTVPQSKKKEKILGYEYRQEVHKHNESYKCYQK